MIQSYFGNRITEIIIHEQLDINPNLTTLSLKLDKNEVLVLKINTKRLKKSPLMTSPTTVPAPKSTKWNSLAINAIKFYYERVLGG